MRIPPFVILLFFAACNNDERQTPVATSHEVTSVVDKGAAIFQQNCRSCHMLNNDMTGPKLKGVLSLWNNDTAKLKAFIRNPSALIASGEPLALQAQKKGHGASMTAFPRLSDEDLNALLVYFDKGQ